MEVWGRGKSFMVLKPQRDDTTTFGCLSGIFTVGLLYQSRLSAWIVKMSDVYVDRIRPL
jgi:maleate cis-trans isomerase